MKIEEGTKEGTKQQKQERSGWEKWFSVHWQLAMRLSLAPRIIYSSLITFHACYAWSTHPSVQPGLRGTATPTHGSLFYQNDKTKKQPGTTRTPSSLYDKSWPLTIRDNYPMRLCEYLNLATNNSWFFQFAKRGNWVVYTLASYSSFWGENVFNYVVTGSWKELNIYHRYR